MATSPEKIKMFSLPDSGSDLASFSPADQNEEEVRSKEKSPPNPASPIPFDGSPKPSSPCQDAHCHEKFAHDPVPSSHEENPNPCANPNQEPVRELIEDPAPCSENQSHGTEERTSCSHVGGGGGETTGQENATVADNAALRKLPAWAQNRSTEPDKGMCGRSEIQTQKEKENNAPLLGSLKEVVEAFSGDFDEKKYADMDILEIMEMKGVVFENPSWWPTEDQPIISNEECC